jgi:glycosyltransferase involved in cell wall biosynthesis
MQEVVTKLSESLVTKGHEVTIATSYNAERKDNIINGVKIVGFKIKGNVVTGIAGEIDEYQSFLKSEKFDVVTNFAAQQWATDLMLPILSEVHAKKVFVPTGFSALGNPLYDQYFENMKTWLKGYDANVFLSDNYRDINFARKNGIQALEIIPNGASKEEFENVEFVDIRELLNVPPDAKLVLTVGSHTGYKGHSAAIKIFEQARIKNSVLLIVGNVTTKGGCIVRGLKGIADLLGLKRSNCSLSCHFSAGVLNLNNNIKVRIKQLSRSQTVNAYKQADIFLFPSLIECSPIVLFEALAGKTPFLVSNVGNSEEIIRWTKGGKMLPTQIDNSGLSLVDINDSALMLKTFINSKTEMNECADLGHEAFLNQFTWEKIADRYQELYTRLISDKLN